MKTLSIAAGLLLVLGGCSGENGGGGYGETTETPASAPSAATEIVETGAQLAAQERKIMEVGCALCSYKMPGADTCMPAILVEGTPMLVSGLELDEHGFCGAPREALVAGSVVGDEFVATSLQVQ